MDSMKKRKVGENGVVLSDSEPNPLTIEDARKITESLNYEQLLGIVQNAAVRHIDVLDAVRSFADVDASQRKLFIRGLGWDTTTEKLRNIFSVYGELAEAVVILDKATGKSKGYGFITFKHVDGALLALKEPSKSIDGRMTITQLASAGITPTVSSNPVDVSLRKIYVANVPYDMTADRLLAHFSMYGDIEEGPFGFDKVTGKSKGFALMVYKTEESASAALVDSIKNIDGHQVTCKMANDKKGKPEAAPGGVQVLPTGVPAQGHGDGIGMHPPVSMPGSQFAGPGGISSYGAYPGGIQGQGVHSLNSSLPGGPGFSSLGSHTQSSLGVSGGYGSGLGAPYGGFGGPGTTGYGGLGGASGGLGAAAGGFAGPTGGLGGAAGGFNSAAGGFGSAAGGFAGPTGGLGGAAGGFGGAAGGFSGGAAGGFGGAAGGFSGGAGGLGGGAGGLGAAAAGLGGGAGGLGGGAGGLGSAGAGAGGLSGGAGGLGVASVGLSSAAGGLGAAAGGLGGATGGLVGTGGGLGGAGGVLGGTGAGLSGTGSGLGGAGRSSSMFGGPTSSVGMASGGYPESAHYSLSGSGYQSQYSQTAGTSPVPRVPPGRMYQGGIPPYY